MRKELEKIRSRRITEAQRIKNVIRVIKWKSEIFSVLFSNWKMKITVIDKSNLKKYDSLGNLLAKFNRLCFTLGPLWTNLFNKLRSWMRRGLPLALGTTFNGETTKDLKIYFLHVPSHLKRTNQISNDVEVLLNISWISSGFNVPRKQRMRNSLEFLFLQDLKQTSLFQTLSNVLDVKNQLWNQHLDHKGHYVSERHS